MWMLKTIFLAFVSAALGLSVAGGYLALISMIGIIPRLAAMTKSSKQVIRYENALIYGALVGNILYSFPIVLKTGSVSAAIAGFFGGVFIGCLAGALAEVVNVIPGTKGMIAPIIILSCRTGNLV